MTNTTKIKTKIGHHTFCGNGINAFIKNGGKLETAQQIASDESPRTTNRMIGAETRISLAEVGRIAL